MSPRAGDDGLDCSSFTDLHQGLNKKCFWNRRANKTNSVRVTTGDAQVVTSREEVG